MTTLYIDAEGPAQCADCAWKGDARLCGGIHSAGERLAAGEIVPCGTCPDCGACCHLIPTPEEAARERIRGMADRLLSFVQQVALGNTEFSALETKAQALITEAEGATS